MNMYDTNDPSYLRIGKHRRANRFQFTDHRLICFSLLRCNYTVAIRKYTGT